MGANCSVQSPKTVSRYAAAEYPHRQVNLLGSDWTIYVVPKKHPRLLGAWGTTHFNLKTIYITNHLSEKNFKWTLTHELLHAFLDELGCHSMLLEKIHKKKNEEMVDGLAKALYPLVRKSVFKIPNYHAKGREKE